MVSSYAHFSVVFSLAGLFTYVQVSRCIYLASGLSTCTFLVATLRLFFKSALVWFTQVLAFGL